MDIMATDYEIGKISSYLPNILEKYSTANKTEEHHCLIVLFPWMGLWRLFVDHAKIKG